MQRCIDCALPVADVGCERCADCHVIELAQTQGISFAREAAALKWAKRIERCGVIATIRPTEWARGGGYRVTIQRKAAPIAV
jgi:hypothetical protein